MNARHFAELQRVEHQAGKPVRGEPDGAILILKLGSERMRGMSAEIEDGRRWPAEFLGT